jgi:NAD(P)-dependent dehydrogenase (short-subunit alcohol dehydrogenase family)
MRGLDGKVAVVAGGGSGIGAAAAERLAEEGVSVVIGDIVAPNADAVAAAIRAKGGRAVAAEFDISDDESVAGLVAAAVAEFGGLDLVHANAADLSAEVIARDSDALDVELDVFDRTIAVNLRGHLLCTRHSIPEMLRRGGGVIVYTSSAAGHVGEPERPSYAMSKSGLNALMRHVSSRWGREGIRANCVAPGLIMTKAMRENTDPEFGEFRALALGLGRSPRLGEPEDIAAAVAFLMSEDASWITGQVISVDGGATIRP